MNFINTLEDLYDMLDLYTQGVDWDWKKRGILFWCAFPVTEAARRKLTIMIFIKANRREPRLQKKNCGGFGERNLRL